jgi:hypothetical protein
MLRSRYPLAVAAVALVSACARGLSAQNAAPRLSFDAAVGGGHGWRGGERVERGLITSDLLIAIRVANDQGFLLGLEASRYWQMNGDLLCILRPDGRGGCIPQYPGFDALNLVGGLQWHWLRILGGPGYYAAYFDHNSTTSRSLGVGARTDLAVPLYEHISANVVARAAWVPRLRDQSYVPGALMVGLRLQTGR